MSLFDDTALAPATSVWPSAAPALPASPAAPATPAQPAPHHEPTRTAGDDWPRHPRADRHLLLAGVRVAYWLRRSRRRTIGFTVGPDGLVVSAPRWVALGDIESALREKATWVAGKLQEQSARARRAAAARITWVDGAEFAFLGEPVRVTLGAAVDGAVLVAAAPDGAAQQPLAWSAGALDLPPGWRAVLRLSLPLGAGEEQVRDAVQSWLQRQALPLFLARCAHYAGGLGVTVRRVSLSAARTRWGSASVDGAIRLNWRLVHFRLPTIDYVVVHELAHLREMNHSPAFWDVVRSVMPEFESARAPLKDDVSAVH